MSLTDPDEPKEPSRQPVFNVPGAVLGILIVLAAFHAVRTLFLDPDAAMEWLFLFAFVPARFETIELVLAQGFPVLWTPVTYSLLHGDWLHLAMNAFWMLAFGSAVAQRMGAFRFLVFAVLASVSGALLHLVMHWAEPVPMIGASAVVSGCMGAACRFAFPPGREFRVGRSGYTVQSLRETLANRQAMTFIAIWLVLNYLFGSGIVDVTGDGGRIAWEAHLGGFLLGLLAFPLLDRANPDRTRS